MGIATALKEVGRLNMQRNECEVSSSSFFNMPSW